MIKYWQSMQDYKYFLTQCKVHFDSSERNRLHTELWKPWQKLRLLDTDKAMEFLLPFYSATGRPAMNQPQILRSFILFFLLFSEGLLKPSLTLWVARLKSDRVLAALVGYSTDSLPPLGSYFDFMNRLWTAPKTDLYARNKLLPASWNNKKPDKPKGKKQKAQKAKPKITEVIEKRLIDGKDIPFNFEERLQRFFYHVAVLPSMECGLIPGQHLTVSGDGTAVHTHACPRGHHRDGAPHNLRHFPDPDASGWDSDLDKFYFGLWSDRASFTNPIHPFTPPANFSVYSRILFPLKSPKLLAFKFLANTKVNTCNFKVVVPSSENQKSSILNRPSKQFSKNCSADILDLSASYRKTLQSM